MLLNNKFFTPLTLCFLLLVNSPAAAHSVPSAGGTDHPQDEIELPFAELFFKSLFADVRNAYTEPGSNTYQTSINNNANEYIDSSSGLLQLKYSDIYVPANGGLGINVQRNYLGIQPFQFRDMTAIQRGVNGLGWQMHYGKLVGHSFNNQSFCDVSPSFPDDPIDEIQTIVSSLQSELTIAQNSNSVASLIDSGGGLSLEVLQQRIIAIRRILSKRVSFSNQINSQLQDVVRLAVHDLVEDYSELSSNVSDQLTQLRFNLSDIATGQNANGSETPNDTSSEQLFRYFLSLLRTFAVKHSTRDSIAYEFPDGSRHVFFRNDLSQDGSLVTLSRMRLHCEDGTMVVTFPDGTVHYMSEFENFIGQRQPSEYADHLEWGEPSWYVSKIKDVYNNELNFTYAENDIGIKYVTGVISTDSNALSATYEYENTDEDSVRLVSVTAGEKVWTYGYETVVLPAQDPRDQDLNFNVLSIVTRPDGRTIEYDYDPITFQLTLVKQAYNAVVDYTYQTVDILPGVIEVEEKHKLYSAIESVMISGDDTDPVTWSYNIQLNAESDSGSGGLYFDRLSVTGPFTDRDFYHYSAGFQITNRTSSSINARTWGAHIQTLHLVEHTQSNVVDDSSSVVAINAWADRSATDVSNQEFSNGINLFDYLGAAIGVSDFSSGGDSGVSFPTVLSRGVNDIFSPDTIGGGADVLFLTSYGDFDEFGFPRSSTEFSTGARAISSNPSASHREHTMSYKNDTQRWILGLPESDNMSNGEDNYDSTFEYDENGSLRVATRAGVTTTYTYTNAGDLATVTDANDHTTTFENYANGTPQRTTNAEDEVTQRTINPTGTIADITDPRGNTSIFEYDNLDRVTLVDPPAGLSITLEYPTDKFEQITTRGPLRSVSKYDVRGRMLESDVGGIVTTYDYDEENRNTFVSNPDVATGTDLTYDAIGRLTSETDPSGATATYTYNSFFNRVTINNKRGFDSTYFYSRYGFEKYLTGIEEIINSTEVRRTNLNYNIVGARTRLIQGDGSLGLPRDYFYDSNFFLQSKFDPEIGDTSYQTDNVGNVTSSTIVETGRTTGYVYDDVYRLKQKDYPDGTDDISYNYFPDGLLQSTSTGEISTSYTYDDNDNIKTENLTIGGRFPRELTLSYDYDGLDNLASMTYPDGLSVDYAPDPLGRPTRVGSFASDVVIRSDGQLASLTLGNGLTMSKTYDTRLLPESITTPNIVGLNYEYDAMANFVSINNRDAASQTVSGPPNDIYDGLDRLQDVTTTVGRIVDTTAYQYDIFGNLSSVVDEDLFSSSIYLYSSKNRLSYFQNLRNFTPDISLDYDGYGNVVSKTELSKNIFNEPIGVQNERFVFDDASRLLTVEMSQQVGEDIVPRRYYSYDGHNQRVISQVPGTHDVNYSFYSISGDLVYEESVDTCEKFSNVRLGTMLLARQNSSSQDARLDFDGDRINDCLETVFGLNPNLASDAAGDLDGDGVSNADEILLHGTSPSGADSDGDGLDDGDEVADGSNPNNSDSDGDGIDDFDEDVAELDPTNADTDNDGISDATELFAQLDPLDPRDGPLDLDFDGFSNRQEDLLGFDPSSNASTPSDSGAIEWTFQGLGGSVLAAPVIGPNGLIYFATERGYLHSVYPNGRLNWSQNLDGWIHGSVAFDEHSSSLYLSNGRALLAYDLNGQELWSSSIADGDGSPAIDAEGNVYIADDRRLYGFDSQGNLLWFTQFPPAGLASSKLAISAEGLIIAAYSNHVTAFDIVSGEVIWDKTFDLSFTNSAPALTDNGHIVVAGAGSNREPTLMKLDPRGEIVWSVNYMTRETNTIFSSPVISPDGTIYVGTIDDLSPNLEFNLEAFNSDGTELWQYPIFGAPGTPAIAEDGTVYVSDFAGVLHAVNQDGSVHWSNLGLLPGASVSETIGSPSIDVDGTVYLGFDSGVLQAYADNTNGAALSWSGLAHGGISSANECQVGYVLYSHVLDEDSDGLPDCFEVLNGLNLSDPADGNIDGDGDGLTRGQEFQLGLDDNNADIDNDGLNDGEEIDRSTDPTNADSDGDGISDGDEVDAGTDPNQFDDDTGPVVLGGPDEDSDGDGFSNRQESFIGTNPANSNSIPDNGAFQWTHDLGRIERNLVDGTPFSDPVGIALSKNQTTYHAFEDGDVVAVDSFGDRLWNKQLTLARGDLVLDGPMLLNDEMVLFLTHRDVVALNPLNGEEIFSFALPNNLSSDSARSNGPVGRMALLDESKIVVAYGSDSPVDNSSRGTTVVALDNTGNPLWSTVLPLEPSIVGNSANDTVQTVKVDGYGQVRVIAKNGVATINPTNGIVVSQTRSFEGENLFFGVLSRSGAVIASGSLLSSFNAAGVQSVIEETSNRVFAINENEELIEGNRGRILSQTGEELASLNIVGFAPLAIANSNEIITRRDSSLMAQTQDGETLWETDIVNSRGGALPPRGQVKIGADGTVYFADDVGIHSYVSDVSGLADGVNSWPILNHDNFNSNNICRTKDRFFSPSADTDNDGIPDCIEYLAGLRFDFADDASEDTDGDFLSNLEEYNARTDILDSDSDNDGLSDYDELIVYNTNPNNIDSDSDGASDRDEIDGGTDPNINLAEVDIADNDNDGIADQWEIQFGLDPTTASDRLADTDQDGFSNLIEFLGESDPTDFSDTPSTNYYIQTPEQSGSDIRGISLSDSNNVEILIQGQQGAQNGSPGILNFEQSFIIPNQNLFDGTTTVRTSGFSAIAHEENATGLPINNFFFGNQFIVLPSIGVEHRYSIYSPKQEANVESGIGAPIPVPQDAGHTEISRSELFSFESDSLIGVMHSALSEFGQNGELRNNYAVPPTSLNLWGIRSNNLIGAAENDTLVMVYSSNGETEIFELDRGTRRRITIGEDLPDSEGSALHIISNKPISAIQDDDGDSNETAAFYDTAFLADRYGLPVETKYVAVVCALPNTNVTLRNSNSGLLETGVCEADGFHPGKAYFSTPDGSSFPAGTILESSKPVYIVYESEQGEGAQNALGRFAVLSAESNNQPAVSIVSPNVLLTGVPRQPGPILLEGIATDIEDGDISDNIIWRSDLESRVFEADLGPSGDGVLGIGRSIIGNLSNLGTHTISAIIIDAGGKLVVSDRFIIRVVDGQNSDLVTISAPADLTVEATAVLTPVNDIGSATASDSLGNPLTTVANNNAGPYPLGVNEVIWTATDSASRSSTDIQFITIVDTTAPTIIAPDSLTLEAGHDAVFLQTPIVEDIFPVTISRSPIGVSFFPVGVTTVTWTATDTSGNTATATQLITVSPPAVDPSLPTISVAGGTTEEGGRIVW